MCTLDRTRDPFQVASSPHPVLSSSLPSRQAGFSQCCVCTLFVESFSPCVVFPVCFCRCCFSNLRLNPFVIFLCSPSVCNCQCICLTKNEERGFCEWRFRVPGILLEDCVCLEQIGAPIKRCGLGHTCRVLSSRVLGEGLCAWLSPFSRQSSPAHNKEACEDLTCTY